MLKKHGNLHATVAMVANDYDIPVRVDFFATHRHAMHGDVLRPVNLAEFAFPGFAYIQQERLGLARVAEPFGQFLYANLFHQREKLLSAVAPSSGGTTVSNRLTVL